MQNLRLSSFDTTAIGRPPTARVISSAMLPRPPAAPHTSTASPFSTVCGGQPMSIRYAVEAQRRKHPDSSQVRRLGFATHWRSEEHTSELQSHSDLVCRLLLEKKKKKNKSTNKYTRIEISNNA